MADKETFLWPVLIEGTTKTVEYQARAIQFGDGYEQRQAKGIMPKMATWNVNFLDYYAKIAEIEAFLDRHAGIKSFWWQPTTAMARLTVKVDKYTLTPKGGDVWELAFTMTEVAA